MANTTLKSRILHVTKTTADWGTNKTVLLKGELAIEFPTSGSPKFKVGDGVKTFAELPYATITPEELSSAISAASHSHANKGILDAISAAFTTDLKTKLDSIATGATKITVDSALSSTSTNPVQNKVINSALGGKANTSHGNHVPAMETANNAKFLRNDNTWATVTPGNIGAAATSHGTHVTYGTDAPKAPGTASAGSAASLSRSDHVHPIQTTVSGNAGTATKLATARTIGLSGGVTGTATSFDGTGNITIPVTSVDATKLQGKVPLDNLPTGALERCVIVENDVARLALTTAKVQTGDTVKVTETNKMYFIVDDTKLASEDGYEVYTAGTASSVPWSGITGKPSTFAPSAHTHTVANVTGLQTALDGKATAAQGTKADTAVQTIKINGTAQTKTNGEVNLPAYPTSLPASDVYAWAKASTKPAYTKSEVGLGNVDNTSDASKTVSKANQLTTARTIGISGAVTGTATSFNGTANVTIATTALDAAKLTLAASDVLILDGSF